jgi:hypothetical protein
MSSKNIKRQTTNKKKHQAMASHIRKKIIKLGFIPTTDKLLDLRFKMSMLKIKSRIYYSKANVEINEIDNLLDQKNETGNV